MGLVGWSWSVVVCASRFGVGGLEVGQWWAVPLGLGLVGWGWLVVGWAGRFGIGGLGSVSGGLCFEVGGLGLVGRGLCVRVWGWWVGVGQWWFVL